jgi:hypothetical protein
MLLRCGKKSRREVEVDSAGIAPQKKAGKVQGGELPKYRTNSGNQVEGPGRQRFSRAGANAEASGPMLVKVLAAGDWCSRWQQVCTDGDGRMQEPGQLLPVHCKKGARCSVLNRGCWAGCTAVRDAPR